MDCPKSLPIIAVSYGAGLGCEFLFAQFRKHPVNEGFLVTGMLIPLCMPPDVPLWMVALATIFAVNHWKRSIWRYWNESFESCITCKSIYILCLSSSMTGENVWIADKPDGYSGATSLSNLSAAESVPVDGNWLNVSGWSVGDMFLGFEPGVTW